MQQIMRIVIDEERSRRIQYTHGEYAHILQLAHELRTISIDRADIVYAL